jgi:hypothetical protein
MKYAVYAMSWLPEPYAVVRLPECAIVYRDIDRLAALAVCESLAKLTRPASESVSATGEDGLGSSALLGADHQPEGKP